MYYNMKNKTGPSTAFRKTGLLNTLLLFLFTSCLFSCCNSIEVYEKNTVIPDYKWKSNFAATGNFSISDTTPVYNIYIVLRHTDAYLYNNIWINAGFQSPGDSMQYQKVNLSLGTDREGWEGSGANDIWEVRKLVGQKHFRKAGEYRFSLTHIMRDEPLLYVMSAGVRLEKAP